MSEDVAVTPIVWTASVSRSRVAFAARVTTPDVGSISNKPPGLSWRVKLTLSEISASLAAAIMPTGVPGAAFSDNTFRAKS